MKGKLVFTCCMPIRWGDMDMMGHVNNTVYFRYFEQARIEWFEQIGATPDPAGQGPVIVDAHCTFIKQLKYPGEIEVSCSVGPPGRSSFETYYALRVVGSDVLHAEGSAKVVWVDFPAEKSAPLPQRLRDLLEGEAGVEQA